MNKKKIAILVSITIIILLFLVLLIFVITNNKDNKKEEIKDDTKIEEKIDKEETPSKDIPKEENPTEEETSKKEEEKKEEPKKEEPKKEERKPATPLTPKVEDKSVPLQEAETTPPPIEYTCPNGYTLNGTKCTITTNATLQCPEGTVEGGEPSGCFKFSEGVEVEGTTCPAGQVGLTIIGWGTPDKYMCHPSYNKVYVCEAGYELNDNKCTKTIDATKN